MIITSSHNTEQLLFSPCFSAQMTPFESSWTAKPQTFPECLLASALRKRETSAFFFCFFACRCHIVHPNQKYTQMQIDACSLYILFICFYCMYTIFYYNYFPPVIFRVFLTLVFQFNTTTV